MPITTFEIRVCNSCGLRYPRPTSGDFPSRRCPACTGETRLILSRNLVAEPKPNSPGQSPRRYNFSILFDNIRSAWNVGSILRSADGFGFTHAYFCGITPTPDIESVRKTSLGAENTVPWTHHKNAVLLVEELKAKDWRAIALEEDERSRPLTKPLNYQLSSQSILIIGNEIVGVDPHLLDLCDEIYHIPMLGEKKSFNAAVAFGIAAYALC